MKPHRSSILEEFQQEIRKKLLQINGFQDLALHVASQSWFESQIRSRSHMASGFHVVIQAPVPLRIAEGVMGPIFETLELCIEVLEHPISNLSGWSALALAEEICRQLHHLPLRTLKGYDHLVCRSEHPWTYHFEEDCNRIQLYFHTSCALQVPAQASETF